MKVKTLRFKDTKDFVHVMERGALATSSVPDILADSATIEGLKKYYDLVFPKKKIDYDNLEIVEFDFIESGEIGADIRNKLTPPLNLVEMLEEYFTLESGELKERLSKFIKAEMKQTKISVEYLSKLF